MNKTLLDDIPQVISIETVKEIQKLSNIVELGKEQKLFLSKLLKKYDLENSLFIENNIDKTLDNINNDLHKNSFTGKEIKSIISNYKFNQYNMTLLKLFQEMASLAFDLQTKKEEIKLIEPVDIFTIIYITKAIEDVSENTLLDSLNEFFYEEAAYDSIFNIESMIIQNPFKRFLNSLSGIEIRTESVLETQKIDDFFFVD